MKAIPSQWRRRLTRPSAAPPSIARLIGAGRPFAVVRRVRPVVVDAFNSEAFRSRTHILEKQGGRISPFLAHENSPRAIPVEVMVSRHAAPRLSLVIRPQFRRDSPTRRSAMSQVGFRGEIPDRAAATGRMAASQVERCHHRHFAAIARALPFSPFPDTGDGAKGCEPTIFLAAKVHGFHSSGIAPEGDKGKMAEAAVKEADSLGPRPSGDV